MTKIGKKYKEAKKLVDRNKKYSIQEAVDLAIKSNYAKFNTSVDVNIKTFADPKYNDQIVRATTVLPHGTGKSVKIAAFVSDEMIEQAKKYGADIVGSADLLKKIEGGEINFDILVTTTDMMKDLAKVAKTLGPKGLMPSPKAGTVTNDLESTITEIKKGRVEFKTDKTGNINVGVGKIKFKPEQLVENISALLTAIEQNKPTGVKGKLIKKMVISSTMGPGIQIDI
ncbi:MAG TPA: 50S ribosomal protein L1 [Candidatus Absconditabacterales bacterium]|nr:50S ribosomal protein L1 [Candidatus Absconditabacterales bacterium]HMT27040.1 50S ribosomal protein L1 [Candidatus Absconditabacterales bacterium]